MWEPSICLEVCEMWERCNSSRYKCWLLVSVLVLFLFYCSLTQYSPPPNSLLSPSKYSAIKRRKILFLQLQRETWVRNGREKKQGVDWKKRDRKKNNVIIEVKTQSNVVMSFFFATRFNRYKTVNIRILCSFFVYTICHRGFSFDVTYLHVLTWLQKGSTVT